jgi:hypothetical protein
VSNPILELVSLYLFDHGPSTMTDIALGTCIGRASLRTHLTLNLGHRYSCALSEVDGVPTRTWSLAPPDPLVQLENLE